MIIPFEYLYSGSKLVLRSAQPQKVGEISAVGGQIKSVSIIAPNAGLGNFIFNVKVNGESQFSGPGRMTINSANKIVTKSALSINVNLGDLISFHLEEAGQAGLLPNVYFIVNIDDGVSASVDTEALQDLVAAMFISGSNTSWTYNDADGTLKVDSVQLTDEQIQDKVAAFVTGGANTTVTYNDGANTLTIAETNAGKTQEEIEDIVAALLHQGSNITLTYNDAGNSLTIAASASGASNLDSLTDVVITAPTIGQLLRFDGTNWVNATVASGGAALQIDAFTANGMWTKPLNAKDIEVFAVGSGAGGGSARKGAAGSVRYSGGGGSGGSICHYKFSADQLTSTVAVTVGAAGTGGASVTANSTNGASGTNGGDSTFGGYLRALGGSAGGAGTSGNGGAGGAAVSGFPLTQFSSLVAGAGAALNGNAPLNSTIAPGSGGGGGGMNTGNTPNSGAAGGGITTTGSGIFYTGGSPIAGGAQGAAGGNGGNGNNAGTNAFNGGSGGGGGGSSHTGNGGNGGNGGFPGGGGGGGGAATDGVGNSGKGGDGGAGFVLVITYF